MKVIEVIDFLESKRLQTNDTQLQNRIVSLIGDLNKYFGTDDEINDEIVSMIDRYQTNLSPLDYNSVIELNEMFIFMKHRRQCSKFLNDNHGVIDGEKAQWVTTIIQGIVGLVSVVFAVLIAFKIIPLKSFGALGANSDTFYYIVGTVGQQVVALAVAIVIGVINRKRRDKMYIGKDFSFEELLVTKYGNKKGLWLLSPSVAEISKNIFVFGNENKLIKKYKPRAKTKDGDIYQTFK